MRWTWLAAGLVLLAGVLGCSSDGHPSQHLVVTYRDGNSERDLITTIAVPVGVRARTGNPRWAVTFDANGCSGDGRTLILSNRSNSSRVPIGQACVWGDEPGPISPDGRYLVAWLLGDGASATIHLVDLSESPVDAGEVPGSQSANYAATWTNDERLWFTSDVNARESSRVFGYSPSSKRTVSVQIPRAILVRGLRAAGSS